MAVIKDFDEDLRGTLAAVEDELKIGGHRNQIAPPPVFHIGRIGQHSAEVVKFHVREQRQYGYVMRKPETQVDVSGSKVTVRALDHVPEYGGGAETPFVVCHRRASHAQITVEIPHLPDREEFLRSEHVLKPVRRDFVKTLEIQNDTPQIQLEFPKAILFL